MQILIRTLQTFSGKVTPETSYKCPYEYFGLAMNSFPGPWASQWNGLLRGNSLWTDERCYNKPRSQLRSNRKTEFVSRRRFEAPQLDGRVNQLDWEESRLLTSATPPSPATGWAGSLTCTSTSLAPTAFECLNDQKRRCVLLFFLTCVWARLCVCLDTVGVLWHFSNSCQLWLERVRSAITQSRSLQTPDSSHYLETSSLHLDRAAHVQKWGMFVAVRLQIQRSSVWNLVWFLIFMLVKAYVNIHICKYINKKRILTAQ